MKVIDHSIEVLPQCPVNIAKAVQKAADTIVDQGKIFATEVTATATSLNKDLQKVAEQMKAIPDLFNPQPIIDCCTGVLAQTAGVQKVIASANGAVEAMSTLMPELSGLVPDFGAQMTFFNSLPGRGQALAELAKRTGVMVEQYGRDLLPLSKQLQQLATMQGGPGAGNDAMKAVLARAG